MGFLKRLFGSGTKDKDQHSAKILSDMLFGDKPIEEWPTGDASNGEPWDSFIAARSALYSGNTAGAIERWRFITSLPDLESRQYVQAWSFLRGQGVNPAPEVAKQVLGMVLEVEMSGGMDLLAAYSDHHARYFNHGGGGVIWERPDESLDNLIDDLLGESSKVVALIGPWNEPRRRGVAKGCARISFLTPDGLHFGEGPFDALAETEPSKAVIAKATELMLTLQATALKPAGESK